MYPLLLHTKTYLYFYCSLNNPPYQYLHTQSNQKREEKPLDILKTVHRQRPKVKQNSTFI